MINDGMIRTAAHAANFAEVAMKLFMRKNANE